MAVACGVSKSEVSRICAGLDKEIEAFGPAAWPTRSFRTYSATPPSARCVSGRTWSPRRWWWPPGCPSTTREVLGTAVGDSESYEFWREFLASLKARGLSGYIW